MGWLDNHLKDFVEPVLGHIPSCPDNTGFLTVEELTVIKNIWRSCKKQADKRPILLPGRDVWIFYVLACRENLPVIYRPDISRLTVDNVTENYRSHFVLDTGFAGTIPRKLGCDSFSLASAVEKKNQSFPKLTGSRHLALKIEKLPKYWNSATMKDGVIFQELAPIEWFTEAAQLTIQVYKNSAPKFIDQKNPMKVTLMKRAML